MLSLACNLWLAGAMDGSPPTKILPQSSALKVHLLAKAAPLAPAKQQTIKQASPTLKKEIINPTRPNAIEKIALNQPQITTAPTIKRSATKLRPEPPRDAANPDNSANAANAASQANSVNSARSSSSDRLKHPAINHHQGSDKSNVIHQANYRKQVPPIYPLRALELGQQGRVTLHVKILPKGFPSDLKIVRSSGFRLLDMAALNAVKQWEFEPTIVNNQAVISWVSVPVRFVIHD